MLIKKGKLGIRMDGKNILDQEGLLKLSELFQLLSDPTRIRIVNMLYNAEMCVEEIAHEVGKSQSLVSHHLSRLKARDIVAARQDGKRSFYRLGGPRIERIVELLFISE